MIRSNSLSAPYETEFSNGTHKAIADVPPAKGGRHQGFGPHELVEAALATCLTMTVQMVAAKRGFPLTGASCEVRLDRSNPELAVLRYDLNLEGSLTNDQANELREAARHCPVGRTLMGPIMVSEENG